MTKRNKKTNLFTTLIIMLRTGWATFYYSFIVLVRSLYSPCSREEVDKLSKNWAHDILRIVKIKCQVKDPYHLKFIPGQNYILMSNHISHYDIPLILANLPGSIRMLAKKELFKVPIWGPAIRKAEFPSIDRENRAQALKDLEYAKEKMKSGIILWIAPEGTRSRTGKLQNFKKGGFRLAIQSNALIIPLTIKGTDKVLPPDTWHFSIGEQAQLHIGECIDAASYNDNYQQLSDEVERRIRLALAE